MNTTASRTIELSPFVSTPDVRVLIKIAPEDGQRFERAERFGKNVPDPWVAVTDVLTGESVSIRRFPCGLGCKCDLELQP